MWLAWKWDVIFVSVASSFLFLFLLLTPSLPLQTCCWHLWTLIWRWAFGSVGLWSGGSPDVWLQRWSSQISSSRWARSRQPEPQITLTRCVGIFNLSVLIMNILNHRLSDETVWINNSWQLQTISQSYNRPRMNWLVCVCVCVCVCGIALIKADDVDRLWVIRSAIWLRPPTSDLTRRPWSDWWKCTRRSASWLVGQNDLNIHILWFLFIDLLLGDQFGLMNVDLS